MLLVIGKTQRLYLTLYLNEKNSINVLESLALRMCGEALYLLNLLKGLARMNQSSMISVFIYPNKCGVNIRQYFFSSGT